MAKTHLAARTVERRLEVALNQLLERDHDLLRRNVSERAICSRLAFYVVALFPRHNVDVEYDRHGLDPNQCGRILRYARAPPEYKLVPAEHPAAYSLIHREVDHHVQKSELLRRLPRSAVDELSRFLLNGLVTQLTSMPVDARLDQWLYREIGEVREQQERALEKMLAYYAQMLRTADWTPALIYKSSNAMNAAFAKNALDLFPELQRYERQYEREELGELAQTLYAQLDTCAMLLDFMDGLLHGSSSCVRRTVWRSTRENPKTDESG